jgi:plastocyanin
LVSCNDRNGKDPGEDSSNLNSKWKPDPSFTNDSTNKGYSVSGSVVIGIAIILAIAAGSTVYAMIISESPRIHLSNPMLASKNNAQFMSGQIAFNHNSSKGQATNQQQQQSRLIKQVQAQQQPLHIDKKFVLVQNDFGWNGTSGGPTIRVSKGDVVQITVINAGQMAHNFGIAKLSPQTANIMNNVMQFPIPERIQKIPYSVMAAMPCTGCHPQFQEGQINQFMNPDTQMVTTFRANEVGNYKYFCMVRGHIWLGMIGELDVINVGNPASIPTTTTTTSPLAQQQRAGAT